MQELARSVPDFNRVEMPVWKRRYPSAESLNVAIMGCIVNGPGEAKYADIGTSLQLWRGPESAGGVGL